MLFEKHSLSFNIHAHTITTYHSERVREGACHAYKDTSNEELKSFSEYLTTVSLGVYLSGRQTISVN